MSDGRFPEAVASNHKFVHAVEELRKHRLWFELPSPYQIKIGKFNFFWTTGKITIDGSGKISQRDIEAFIDLVKLNEAPRASPLSRDGLDSSTNCLQQKVPAPVEPVPSETPPWE